MKHASLLGVGIPRPCLALSLILIGILAQPVWALPDKNQDTQVDVHDLVLLLGSRDRIAIKDLHVFDVARDWHSQLTEPDFFYNGSYGKTGLHFSTEWVAVWFTADSTDLDRQTVVEGIPTLDSYFSRRDEGEDLALLLLRPTENLDIVLETLAALEDSPIVRMTSPVIGIPSHPTETVFNGEIAVQFAESASHEEIRRLVDSCNLLVDTERSRWTVLSAPNNSALLSLQVANRLDESPLTNWCQPVLCSLRSFTLPGAQNPESGIESKGTVEGQRLRSFDPDDLYFYDDRGNRVPLTLATDRLYVELADASKAERVAQTLEGGSRTRCSFSDPLRTIVEFERPVTESTVLGLPSVLAEDTDVAFVSPVFSPGSEFALCDRFAASFSANVDDQKRADLHDKSNVQVVREMSSWTILRTPGKSGLDALRAANRYYESGLVEWSQPARTFLQNGFPTTNHPDDPHYYDSGSQDYLQWYLHNDGSYPSGGSTDADIDAPEGWYLATGAASNLVIGFIDSGIDLDHEDLEDKLWTNPGEIAGDDDDNDGNTYVDDVHGYDFADGDDADGPNDLHNHGTAAASIAAGITDNAKGVAGVFWGGQLMALKVSTGGTGTVVDVDVAEAIEYAADEGADIVSVNWDRVNIQDPSDEPDSKIKTAIKYARNEKGVPVIGAAENQGVDYLMFPARYPQVISVGSTDHTNKKFSWSNYGPNLDVMAPSGGTPPSVPMKAASNDGGYRNDFTGTSGAQPQVVGLVALLLSQNPNLSPAEIQSIIQVSADDQVGPTPVSTPTPGEDPPGWDPYYGWGKINVHAALATETALPGSPRHLERLVVSNASPVPTPVWAIDQYGFMYLNGCVKGTHCPTPYQTPIPTANPGKDEVLLERSDGDPAALVDVESGDLFLRGELFTKQTVPTPNPSSAEFILRDADGTPVALLNEDGDLYLKGEYYNESAP